MSRACVPGRWDLDCGALESEHISAGLSITKVLAKVASKHRKPMGFTVIPGRAIAAYLETLPADQTSVITATVKRSRRSPERAQPPTLTGNSTNEVSLFF